MSSARAWRRGTAIVAKASARAKAAASGRRSGWDVMRPLVRSNPGPIPGPPAPSAPVLALFDDDSRVLMTEPNDLAQHLVRLVDSGDRPEAHTIEFLRAELNRDHAGIADEPRQLLAQMLRIGDLQERT